MVEAELFALLEGTADAAFAVDEHGRICAWNASAERLFGHAPAQILNQPCSFLLEGRNGNRSCPCDRCAVPDFDVEVRMRSGDRMWVNISTLVYADPRRDRRLTVHLARDVTERKKKEEFARQVLGLSRPLTDSRTGSRPGVQLSEQEQRILRGFAESGSSSEIARELHISLQTLRNHLHRINQKLDTHSRLEAVMQAIHQGLI
jgi:PAS domain S-box-containing protein